MGKDLKKIRKSSRKQLVEKPFCSPEKKLALIDSYATLIDENNISIAMDQFLNEIHDNVSETNNCNVTGLKSNILIGEYYYKLLENSSIVLRIGLSPNECFNTVIVLEDLLNTLTITFDPIVWWEILDLLKRTKLEFLQDRWILQDEKRHSFSINKYTVYGIDIQNNRPQLCIHNTNTNEKIQLTEDIVDRLNGIFAPIIRQHLTNLFSIDFNAFYKNLFKNIQDILITILPDYPREIEIKHIFNMIENLCILSNRTECLYMLECLAYLREKLANDFISNLPMISVID